MRTPHVLFKFNPFCFQREETLPPPPKKQFACLLTMDGLSHPVRRRKAGTRGINRLKGFKEQIERSSLFDKNRGRLLNKNQIVNGHRYNGVEMEWRMVITLVLCCAFCQRTNRPNRFNFSNQLFPTTILWNCIVLFCSDFFAIDAFKRQKQLPSTLLLPDDDDFYESAGLFGTKEWHYCIHVLMIPL